MTKWYVGARVNSTLLAADTAIENTMERFTAIRRFNDVGTWALSLRREDPHVQTFMPVLSSGVLGFPNGIVVSVDNEDGNGLQTVLSGPQLDIDVKSQADSQQPVLVTGACDNYWLSKRRALQTVNFPYVQHFGPDSSYQPGVSGPARFYTLAETSGTTATDQSGNAQNGTYTGGFTLGQPGLIDDPSTSVKLNGANGSFISVPTAGLPTGNGTWQMFAWGMQTGSWANGILFSLGSNVGSQGVYMGVNASGQPYFNVVGKTQVTGATALPIGVPFLLYVSYDNTTITGEVNGQAFGTMTPGALSITYGTANIGCYFAGASAWPGYVAMAGLFPDHSAYTLIHQSMYAIGTSRQAYLGAVPGYDARPLAGTLPASTVMYQYVLNNAGASALPATTFTNAVGTQTARQIPNISLAADPAIGSQIQGLARLDNLLDLIAAHALMSTPELGFKLEQVGTQLVFTIYQPTDLTTTAIFSRDFYGAQGNVLDYEWKVTKAQANHVIAGGANPNGGALNLASRLFVENENTSSIAADGYLEEFLDYRQSNQGPTVQQAIAARLAQDAQVFQATPTLLDQPGVLYFKGPAGKGYDLGNKVTVIVDGQVFQQVIRQVQIDLALGQPAKIQPAIGTPIRTEIISEYDQIAQRLASIHAAAGTLQTNY